MKRAIVALLLITVSAAAQEAAKKKADQDAMMAFYIEAAKPVAEHGRLAELAGPWKVTTKLWFGPDAEPQISSGIGTGTMILGGRFLEMTTEMKGAMAHESLTIYGFDRRTSEYTLAGWDTLGTYYITAAGKHDDGRKGVVLHGSYAQPPNMQQQKYHFVWTKPSDKEHLMMLYFSTDGKDVRVAETRFTR